MTKGKVRSKKLAMSEPSFKKRKGVLEDNSGTALKKSPLSKTAHKRKSLSGRDLLRLKKQQKQKQEDDVPRRLFPYVEDNDVLTPKSLKQSSKKRDKTQKPNKESKQSLVSTPELAVSENSGVKFDDSLDSTLPFEEGNSENVEKGMSETEDDVISFFRTPATNGKMDREEDMDNTPLFTKKTPMPEGAEQWLYSSEKRKRKPPRGTRKPLRGTRKPARGLRKPPTGKYLLKCENLPKGTTAQYLGLFLAESDLFPEISMRGNIRAGRGRKPKPKYAILYCDTEEERDKLLDLDEITMPSVAYSRETAIRIIPMLTKKEKESSRALRITNLAEKATEQDVREFFEKKDIGVYQIYLYPNDRSATVLFKSADDSRKAQSFEGSKLLKGSELEFHRNRGQMKHEEKEEAVDVESPMKETD